MTSLVRGQLRNCRDVIDCNSIKRSQRVTTTPQQSVSYTAAVSCTCTGIHTTGRISILSSLISFYDVQDTAMFEFLSMRNKAAAQTLSGFRIRVRDVPDTHLASLLSQRIVPTVIRAPHQRIASALVLKSTISDCTWLDVPNTA